MFRKKFLSSRENLFYSEVNISSRTSDSFLIFIFSIIVVSLLAFAFFVEIPKIEKIKGFLYPNNGLITITSGYNGSIEFVIDKNGGDVTVGSIISIIDSRSWHKNGGNVEGELLKIAITKKKNLSEKLIKLTNLKIKKIATIHEKSKTLKIEIEKINDNIKLINEIVENISDNEVAYEKLKLEGYVSKEKIDSITNNVLKYRREIEDLNLLKIIRNNEIRENFGMVSEIEADFEVQYLDINTSILDIENTIKLIQSESERSIVSNVNGKVVTLLKKKGEYVKSDEVIMTILPNYSDLEAKLLVPSKSIGLIKVGHDVKIKFDAFPFQRFGIHHGTVTDIGKSILLPTDINNNPVNMKESFYHVTVNLSHQSIFAYGEEYMLEPGMTFNAEVILERITILDRVLDPIRALRGSFE